VTSTNNSATEPPLPGAGGTLRGDYDISAIIFGLSVGWTPMAM
jgi:hypothetical protein